MSEELKEYFYRQIDELLRRPSDELSAEDVLYLLRSLLEEL